MSNPTSPPEDSFDGASREEILSALFANMVIQQTNMAMMLLGKVPHPETGQTIQDVDAARMFIDQLEMLEAKTKGNLNKQEQDLLKQALTALRMTFVEAVDSPAGRPQPQSRPKDAAPAPQPSSSDAKPAAPSPAPADSQPADESRKKFSKKY